MIIDSNSHVRELKIFLNCSYFTSQNTMTLTIIEGQITTKINKNKILNPIWPLMTLIWPLLTQYFLFYTWAHLVRGLLGPNPKFGQLEKTSWLLIAILRANIFKNNFHFYTSRRHLVVAKGLVGTENGTDKKAFWKWRWCRVIFWTFGFGFGSGWLNKSRYSIFLSC